MDEEIAIINEKTRNEKIKSFFIENRKLLISAVTVIIIIILSFYYYQFEKEKQRQLISEKFNNAVIEFKKNDHAKITSLMKEIIKDNDSTYSPLALYFIIDQKLIENKDEINDLFDKIINQTALEIEIKNLIIYKKALFNADNSTENELLEILKPITNSSSVWKSHALYLMGEYFYSKNEKQKSKEFFNKIISLKKPNQKILKEAQKRLNRDLSE